MVFVGVNCHGRSCILAQGLTSNETTDAHSFMFQNFVLCTNLTPKSIVTDEDHAIASAIACICPSSAHILCSWHLLRNIVKNLAPSKVDFLADISNWMFCNSESEFENYLSLLKDKFKDKPKFVAYLEKKYLIRHKWARYLTRRHLTLNIASTQRVESMNSVIKLNCGSKSSLSDIFNYLVLKRKEEELEILQQDNIDLKKTKDIMIIDWNAANDLRKATSKYVWNLLKKELNGFLNVKVDGRMHDSEIVNLDDNPPCTCLIPTYQGIPCKHILRYIIEAD